MPNIYKYFNVQLSIQNSTNFIYKLPVTYVCSDKNVHAEIIVFFKYIHIFLYPSSLSEVKSNSLSLEHGLYLVMTF